MAGKKRKHFVSVPAQTDADGDMAFRPDCRGQAATLNVRSVLRENTDDVAFAKALVARSRRRLHRSQARLRRRIFIGGGMADYLAVTPPTCLRRSPRGLRPAQENITDCKPSPYLGDTSAAR